jgi:hypothetical protein
MFRTHSPSRADACIDQQVKLRGFRVELGEIEQALLECHGVREGVAVLREADSGTKSLVAYVAAAASAGGASALRAHLSELLPEYMLPEKLVILDRLPRNRNGKVDRSALPEPESLESEGGEYVAPSTATEEVLAGIWTEVLKAGRIGVNDNFFQLGGHSLLATQAIARIARSLSVSLPIREVFLNPTIKQLAGYIDGNVEELRTRHTMAGSIPRLSRASITARTSG